ncbi:MAG: type IV secretory system conjugative DNA transfer family protein [Candidatus Staskawiczbacteria bacterium]|nr:type IV secretory system conjugative DNA transfer family protein [Candidatus Staskawiczbacteria bacterium]
MSIIILGLILVFILILFGFVIALRSEESGKSAMMGGLETVLFLVMMPKNDFKKDDLMQKDEKILISQMEQIFANFLYLKKTKMFGELPCVAFEIASQIGGADISFYVAVPKYLDTAFEKYVQGVYPRAIVEKVPQDYTVFEPQGAVAGAYLKLKENPLFPISTYQNLEKDPLSTITNNLSKISADEGAAIQIIIRPLAGLNLREKGEKVLTKIREGKSARSAMAEVSQSGFLKIIEEIFKGPEGVKNKEKGFEDVKNKQQGIDQRDYDAIQSKIQKQPFQTNIRIMTSAKTSDRAEEILGHLQSAFSQFSLSAINSLEPQNVRKKELKKLIYDFTFRNFNPAQTNILNLEELSSIYHFPTQFIETPYIKSAKSGVAAPPSDLPEKGVNLIGKVLFRGDEKKVYFASRDDRRRHFYVVGQTGTGKTTLLKEMIRQDIENGEGVAVVDPHGELVNDILSYIPKNRVDDIVLFEPFDLERPAGLNMLEYDTPEQKDFAVQEMIAIFYKLFPPEIIGPMFEHYMRNAMLVLMADKDNPGTLVEIPKMFTDPSFLQERLTKVTDPIVRNFWLKEWAQTTGSTKSDMLGYVVSKVGRFIENEMMRNIIGQSHSSFDLSKIMDEGKIFLANLSKGLTGEVNSSLLGLILVSKMQMAAMKRARITEEERKDFYLYVDEFQNFTTDSISTILSEARKYKLNLIMAHQYIPQLTDQIKNAVFGNVGTIASYRIGAEDAEFLEKQFEPEFSRFDLVNLDNFTLILKMMINNKTSTPFKMEAIKPKKGRPEIVDPIRKISKLKYSKARAIVEKEISERSFV